MLRSAHARLTEVRREQPDAGGLVIATDQEHARGIAELLRTRFGTSARVVTSDDPLASAGIAEFAAGSDPWLVAVRMVSEGVDIPRLRVGVYATTTSTELFFRQAVGRLVRWTRGVPRQRAWLFIPDDPRLRRHAAGVAEQRRHSLRQRRRRARASRASRSASSATRSRCRSSPLSRRSRPRRPIPQDDFGDELELDDGPNDEIELTLAPPPPLAGGADSGGTALLTRKEEKHELREANAEGRARARAPHAHDARPGERGAEPALARAQGVGGDDRRARAAARAADGGWLEDSRTWFERANQWSSLPAASLTT